MMHLMNEFAMSFQNNNQYQQSMNPSFPANHRTNSPSGMQP